MYFQPAVISEKHPGSSAAPARAAKKVELSPGLPGAAERLHPSGVKTEGMLGREADCFLKRVLMKLAKKCTRPYSQVYGFFKPASQSHSLV